MKRYIVGFSTLCVLSMVESFFEQRPMAIKTRQQIRLENGGLPEAHVLTPLEKQQYIKDAFIFSWEGYRNYSWGYDENQPVTNQPRNTRYSPLFYLACFFF